MIDDLYEWPRRFGIAEKESAVMDFEVRKVNFGDYLVFYRVDEARKLVEVLSFRQGAKLSDDQ